MIVNFNATVISRKKRVSQKGEEYIALIFDQDGVIIKGYTKNIDNLEKFQEGTKGSYNAKLHKYKGSYNAIQIL